MFNHHQWLLARTWATKIGLAACLLGISLTVMKTIKRIPLGVINIAASPHEKNGATYIKLFKRLAALKDLVEVRSETLAVIATCGAFAGHQEAECLTGEIHKFTFIDGDWENVEKLKPATTAEINQISIPSNLRPNRESFQYFLFPQEHRLVFQMRGEKRSITYDQVVRLLDFLFKRAVVLEEFPHISITPEQEPGVLKEIFDLKQINSLHIHLQRPNPDGFSKKDLQDMEGILREQGAKSIDSILHHAPHESIRPNEDTKKLAEMATSNGRVIATGKDANKRPVRIDTSEHPVVEPFDYDRKNAGQSFLQQLFVAARRAVDRVTKKNKD